MFFILDHRVFLNEIMYLDKDYQLRTGVCLKISTVILQEHIVNSIRNRQYSEFATIHSISDLYAYLSVEITSGAEGLIRRRQRWITRQMKADLNSGRPVPFNDFSRLFWRNLDEQDPDGDEWHQLIASDAFYTQMTFVLNKVRAVVRSLQYPEAAISHLPLGACQV